MKGFTLIELIIYSAIISLFLVVASAFAWQIIQGSLKAEAYQEVEQNANFSLGKIVHALRNSSEVVEPNKSGESSSQLRLNMQDAVKTPTIFEIAGQSLTIKEGGTGPFSLTSDLVEIANLNFTNLSFSNSETIRIEITVERFNPSGRSGYEAAINLETTVNLNK